jgi:deoxyadenosine/deoxycytidine kinase
MKIFSIEGNIGSGKSTLIDLFKNKSDNDNYYYLEEPVSLWNEVKDSQGVTILEKYYRDPKKYAFAFQMMAYITRVSSIKNKINSLPPDSIILTERSIYTDREIFAKMLYDSGNIEDIEYSIYLKWFDEFKTINLDGIIYIQTSPELCSKRVEQRNRKGETIALEYLKNCHNYHESWINNSSVPVFYVDGRPEQSNELLCKIKQFVESNLKN